MRNRSLAPILLCAALGLVAGCGVQSHEPSAERPVQDPVLARALHDPLMTDPDLASRNQANAVLGFHYGHPLPLFVADDEARERARDAMRLELLEDGPIPQLPEMAGESVWPRLADLTNSAEMVEAVGGPSGCTTQLSDDLKWSLQLPQSTSLMPHSMVQVASGVDNGTCAVRVVRYLSPASVEDALEYHFVKTERARFRVEIFDEPEMHLRAERRDAVIAVHFREGGHGMTAVDVIHWRK